MYLRIYFDKKKERKKNRFVRETLTKWNLIVVSFSIFCHFLTDSSSKVVFCGPTKKRFLR